MANKKEKKFVKLTKDIVQKIIKDMEDGVSERESCRNHGVARSTFRTQALRIVTGDQYARALEGLAQDQAEKLEQAIDDMRDGKIDASMARVEIDARKWFASKFLPKRYGDKIDMTTGGQPINVIVSSDAREPKFNNNTEEDGVAEAGS